MRKPSRPPLDENDPVTGSVHLRLPSRVYDDLYRRAQQERISVPEVIRRAIARGIREADGDQ